MRQWLSIVCALLISATAISHARATAVAPDGLYSEPFLVPLSQSHTAPINQIGSDAAGRFLVTGSDDKSIRVWSAESGHVLRVIRVPTGPGFTGRIYAVALSPDGARIAAGGFTDAQSSASHIYLFDRATGQQTGVIDGLPGVVNQLAFSPDGRKLAAALSGTNGVRLFSMPDLRQIGADTDYSDDSHGIAFDRDGKIAATAFDGKIRLYSAGLRLLRFVTMSPGAMPLSIAFQPQGNLLAIGYFGTPRVELLDARNLGVVRAANIAGVDNGDMPRVAWSLDGKTLFAGGSWQRQGRTLVRAWSATSDQILGNYPVGENTVTGLSARADGTLAVASGEPRIGLLPRGGAASWSVEPQIADYRGQHGTFAVSADGSRVQFDFGMTQSTPARLDLHLRQLDLGTAADPTLTPPKTAGLRRNWLNTTTPELNGTPLRLDPHEVSRSLAAAPDNDGFVLGAEWSLRRYRADGTLSWRIAAPGVAWAVNIPTNGRMVIAAFSDGTIRWYRLSDGVELLAFFPQRGATRWVAWSSSGHYMAPPGGEELIQWQVNHGRSAAPDLVSAARFREGFYRPDVVEQVLVALDSGQALAAADRSAGRRTTVPDVASQLPPRVTIDDPADNSVLDRDDVSVHYTVDGRPSTAIQHIRLMADGQLVATHENLSIGDSGRLTGEIRAKLGANVQLLTLVAETGSGSSDPAKVQIRRASARPPAKSNLFVLAVGVGQFQDKLVPTLRYAKEDAEGFAAQMQAQQNGLYGDVEIKPLVNEQATRQAVMDGLFWLEREMQQNDVAAIFISTHGQNDAAGKFYLIPYDASITDEIEVRRTAIRYADIRDILSRLADRGKVLVFVDACHAGSVIPGAKGIGTDVDIVASDLASSENGVVVFSSSTGRQFSWERPELGHGVFTYALLEAFEGKASREPPWLYVSDLEIWLSREVKRLTNGAQTPTASFPKERMIDPRIFRATRAG